MCQKKEIMTTDAGRPVGYNQNSLTAGPRGSIVFEDFLLFEYVCGSTLPIQHSEEWIEGWHAVADRVSGINGPPGRCREIPKRAGKHCSTAAEGSAFADGSPAQEDLPCTPLRMRGSFLLPALALDAR